ncbi:hypothetical protein [Caryophanon latum]|uniref:hypothetical protein n=1 Tax=Caryophanon latum TaxID=33977 RepID=UPI0014718A72|nr:hypothetical protein [Caryophanon latum]
MTNVTTNTTRRVKELPLVEEFKKPSAIVVLGAAFGMGVLYAIGSFGVMFYDMLMKMMS